MKSAKLATLWIGEALSFIEVLCLKSMLATGHQVTLFTYQEVANIPDGVIVKDAREIYNPETIIIHDRTKTPAPHADIFRINLLFKTDYVWTDSDMLFIKELDASSPHIFAYEKPDGIGNSVLGIPSDSYTLKLALLGVDNFLQARKDDEVITHGYGTPFKSHSVDMYIAEVGPFLITNCLRRTGEIKHARPTSTFFPLPLSEAKHMIKPNIEAVTNCIEPNTIGIHLWTWRFKNVILRHMNRDRKGHFFKNCFLGQQCDKYDVNPLKLMVKSFEQNLKVAPSQKLT